uniref:Uncharacterized protein n=1 Tax=Strigamia maritima TaxID=126957 RepID=T1JN13_STRMM
MVLFYIGLDADHDQRRFYVEVPELGNNVLYLRVIKLSLVAETGIGFSWHDNSGHLIVHTS